MSIRTLGIRGDGGGARGKKDPAGEPDALSRSSTAFPQGLIQGRARPRRVQKYKRTLGPVRRAVAEFIYHYHGERNHQGLGNAFVFLDTTGSPFSDTCPSFMDIQGARGSGGLPVR